MLKLKKISVFILPIFLILSSTFSLASNTSSQSKSIDFLELEKKLPRHFSGFAKTDFKLIEKYRHADEIQIFQPDKDMQPYFQKFNDALKTLSNIKEVEPIAKQFEEILKDEKKQSVGYYLLYLATTALSLSKKTDLEKNFFKLAGFSQPYNSIEILDLTKDFTNDEIWSKLGKLISYSDSFNDERGDFNYITHRNFGDRRALVEQTLKKSPFKSIPAYLLCTKPGEDILGFFYLSWCYNKGIHPIPVPLVTESRDELHGICMSPWGKFCHDSAHSKADPADYSVEEFANHVLNHYLTLLNKNLEGKPTSFKKQYSIKSMIPHVVQFANAVHAAYHQSLLEILEASIKQSDLSQEKLPDEFKAFSAGAFLQTHERPMDMSRSYVTPDLHSLIKKSASLIEGIDTKEGEGGEKDLFSTSYITGQTSLSDEEIFKIVLNQPLSSYQHDNWYFYYPEKLKEKDVSEYSVSRNKLSIDVTIDLVDGRDHIYRTATNYSRRLNLKHDRDMLLPASKILKETYQYSLPTVPKEADYEGRTIEFEDAVRNCNTQLQEGTKKLLDYFAKKAMFYSTSGKESSIADKFALSYTNALRALADQMPPFIGDLQKFLVEAVSQDVIEGKK